MIRHTFPSHHKKETTRIWLECNSSRDGNFVLCSLFVIIWWYLPYQHDITNFSINIATSNTIVIISQLTQNIFIPLRNQSPLYTQSHTLYHLRHTIISSHKHSHHTHIHHYILPKQFHPTTVKISTKYSIWYTNAPANHPSLLDEIINDSNTLWIAS